jgi:hypothetical protein
MNALGDPNRVSDRVALVRTDDTLRIVFSPRRSSMTRGRNDRRRAEAWTDRRGSGRPEADPAQTNDHEPRCVADVC